jgi:hypothetical protein
MYEIMGYNQRRLIATVVAVLTISVSTVISLFSAATCTCFELYDMCIQSDLVHVALLSMTRFYLSSSWNVQSLYGVP